MNVTLNVIKQNKIVSFLNFPFLLPLSLLLKNVLRTEEEEIEVVRWVIRIKLGSTLMMMNDQICFSHTLIRKSKKREIELLQKCVRSNFFSRYLSSLDVGKSVWFYLVWLNAFKHILFAQLWCTWNLCRMWYTFRKLMFCVMRL